MRKVALCVGINNYPNPGNGLKGCVNDALDWSEILKFKYGFDHVETIFDDIATRGNVIRIVTDLAKKTSDLFVWTYSGHGTSVIDVSKDEPDGRDEAICLYDALLVDDDIRKLFDGISVNKVFISDSCLSGDTKIPLLSGEEKTIRELCQEKGEYWVYASKENGEIVPAKAHSARVMGTKEIIRITFDNNCTLECTEDHLIMLRDGSFKPAGQLNVGDSLMPCYKRYGTEEDSHYLKGYELVNTVDSQGKRRWKPTHLIVRDFFNIKIDKSKTVCHHKNFNKLDNRPENLTMVSWDEHKKMHRSVASKNLLQVWKNPKFLDYRNSMEYKKKQSNIIRESWKDSKIRERHLCGTKNRDNSKNNKRLVELNKSLAKRKAIQLQWQDLSRKQKMIQSILRTVKDPNSRAYIYQHSEKFKLLPFYRAFLRKNHLTSKNLDFNTWHKQSIELKNNHKIIKIEKLNKVELVYDMTVDVYHNFAISAGIFVHNCHSGTIGKSFMMSADMFSTLPKSCYQIARYMPPPVNMPSKVRSLKVLKPIGNCCGDNDIILTGCMDQEYSYDANFNGKYNGAMTWAAMQLLRNEKGMTYNDFYESLMQILPSQYYPQNPCLHGRSDMLARRLFT